MLTSIASTMMLQAVSAKNDALPPAVNDTPIANQRLMQDTFTPIAIATKQREGNIFKWSGLKDAEHRATEAAIDISTRATEAAIDISTRATEAAIDKSTRAREAAIDKSTRAREAATDNKA